MTLLRTLKTLQIGALALAMTASLAATSAIAEDFIVVQSTTSTQNSGLLDAILPKFQDKTGIEVRVVAVGTGQALKNAANGDGDVLLVHAKPSEEKFVADGNGVERFDVMYNDFVIVGPKSDPAGIKGMSDATAALAKIASSESLFASRGDDSGTHKKEKALWKLAKVDPDKSSGAWYRETGSGMGATLNAAAGMSAYTMSDRATWLAFQNKAGLEVLTQGDDRLFNQYGVILVNPAKHPTVKAEAGQAFIDWLTGPEGQKEVAAYTVDGEQLFFPNAKSSVSN
ncbi:substrate-binding domain-containing protein [Roseibium algae]|uniref:Substrate-binding domain-containing protein n=1 Tax=Roseibium algae TaxID=3123038 RepID=A0ABU8TL13_9HYPH